MLAVEIAGRIPRSWHAATWPPRPRARRALGLPRNSRLLRKGTRRRQIHGPDRTAIFARRNGSTGLISFAPTPLAETRSNIWASECGRIIFVADAARFWIAQPIDRPMRRARSPLPNKPGTNSTPLFPRKCGDQHRGQVPPFLRHARRLLAYARYVTDVLSSSSFVAPP